MVEQVLSSEQAQPRSVEELKQELLRLTQDRDTDPFSQKVQFLKDKLEPIFQELSKQNPFPAPQDQVPLVLGAWVPVWSTIPFQDIIPGRLRNQSYQIFHDNGYYVNVARYTPGQKLPFLNKLRSFLFAYDFMILQKYQVSQGHWFIQNVAIKQALRFGGVPLTLEKAEEWFTQTVQSQAGLTSQAEDFVDIPDFQSLDRSTAKRFEKIFKATPQFEHLYIDRNFRLVKSQREAKQRPSYTIAVRLR
ncbi:MAG: hypothetical protein WCA35_21405 [Kovacikia sp.]